MGREVLIGYIAALLVAVVVSALVVVNNSYQNRQLFIALNNANQIHTELSIEYGKLLLEQSSWSSPALIETIAASNLHMQLPESDNIIVVDLATYIDDSSSSIKLAQANGIESGSSSRNRSGKLLP